MDVGTIVRLSLEERQTLLGSLMVGVLVGAFVSYAGFALNSENQLNDVPFSTIQIIAESELGFMSGVASIMRFMGIFPIIVHRNRNKESSCEQPLILLTRID